MANTSQEMDVKEIPTGITG